MTLGFDSGSVISPESLASTIRSHCKGEVPGLESLLVAALRLSVIPHEGRYPRVHVRTSYKKEHPVLLNLDLPLERLADVAPAVSPEAALLCTWNGEWKISGITEAHLQQDGVGLHIRAPLSISILLPNQLIPALDIVRGLICPYDESWQTAIFRLKDAAAPEDGRDWRTSAYVLARATYKTSIGGHGGAFLLLPSDPTSCLRDILIKWPGTLGPEFDRLWPARGHMNNELVEKCSDTLAALTRVDGAVVMKKDLSLHGFGATIKVLIDSESQSEGGHRHRSAIALCERYRGTVAIVISQDGPISVYGTNS
jgi:DisA bacterial checkpoint controller nucleotide-binding